jgi:hypothetical protein
MNGICYNMGKNGSLCRTDGGGRILASRQSKNKKPPKLEFTVTWMLGCLLLLISNSTIFKSFNASVGEPWFNLLLSVIILIMLVRIAVVFYGLQKDVKRDNSGIDKIDQLNNEGFARHMQSIYSRDGWSTEPCQPSEAGFCLPMNRDSRRVLVFFPTGKRKLTRDYVKLAWMAGSLAEKENGEYERRELWLVTNSIFTSQARQEAAERGIRMTERDALIDFLAGSEPAPKLAVRGRRAAE